LITQTETFEPIGLLIYHVSSIPSLFGEKPSGIFNGNLGMTNKVGFLVVSFGD
jgi:hypothetical protein